MNKIVDYIKSHPWTIGALAVGAIVVFFIVRGASSGTTVVASPASGPSEEAQMAFAGMQLQAGVAQAGVQADLAKASIGADLQKLIATLQHDTDTRGITAQENISLAEIGASTSQFGIQNQTALDIASINAGVQTATINSQERITTAVIEALKPAPVATAPVVVAPPTPTITYVDRTDAILSSQWGSGIMSEYNKQASSKKGKKELERLGISSVRDYTDYWDTNMRAGWDLPAQAGVVYN